MRKDIYKVFKELVAIKSDTGTVLERNVEDYIYEHIKNIDYFSQNPEYYGKYKLSKEDCFDRSVVWGLVKGTSNDTIILINHHDVVDSLDYGVFSEYAYNVDKIKQKLKEINVSQEVRVDLENDKWIFGRGTCDMKAGIALQLYILEQYSKIKEFKGNILFLSVPDEENLSLGMRDGVRLLNKLKDKYGLEYKLLINSEPHQRQIENQGVLYEGSVGKIMCQIYIRGKKTHIGDIYQGLNPSLILSEIIRRIEVNNDFSDVEGEEISPPPSWIYFRDKKERYDVSVPEFAGGYFSVLTLNTTPKEIIEKLKTICNESFEEAIEHLLKSYDRYSLVNSMKEKLNYKVNVKTFEEIYKEAKTNGKDVFIDAYNNEMRELEKELKAGDINLAECGFSLTKKTLEYAYDKSPVVVISFVPPYYPHISNIKLENISDKIKNISNIINEFTTKEFGENYVSKNYFMGISDMSYTGLLNSEETIPYISTNMPLYSTLYTVPLKELKELQIPVINIGPWGKDLHKFTERVYQPDLLEKTPSIIKHVIDYMLD
ncbi:M20/M25/M40 family metallo-hydrolase [Clostridiaceae bacterium M8S5]|nr:M20/M25/M40 family metallo-hydrolase [Clostridiaceae bacterium M8S5]